MSINMQKHIGEKFGRLTIIKRVSSNCRPRYLCKCDCGKTLEVDYGELTRSYGGTKSCGCYRRDKVTKHNDWHNRVYKIYHAMLTRTKNPNHSEYKNYGGRGIIVCDEWLGEDGYKNFKEWALKNGYRDDLSIDRINVNSNYEPSNCRWATRKEQADNKTTTIRITYNNETRTLNEWSKILNISRQNLYNRLYTCKWSVEKAFTTPVKQKGVM